MRWVRTKIQNDDPVYFTGEINVDRDVAASSQPHLDIPDRAHPSVFRLSTTDSQLLKEGSKHKNSVSMIGNGARTV
jgi:hypothetical protein